VSHHIKLLLRLHWTQAQIAAAAGVSDATISTAKVPGVVINVETAQKILAVTPTGSRR
jgi:transcriptional regulator with XRE-family HTH domain